MTTLKVESGIPVTQRHRKNKYPWAKMKVGDSVFVPFKVAGAQNVTSAAHAYARLHRWTFATSCLKDEGGTRVWRTA